MVGSVSDPGDTRKGDKVLVLEGPQRGLRGTIEEVRQNRAVVTLGDTVITVSLTSLQNFSAAARKAWQTRPSRGVGRRKNPTLPAKRMVSIRLLEEVWDALGRAVEAGLIRSREAAVNEWLKEKLDTLLDEQDGTESRDH
jgi:KOW motif-containing protein